MPAYVPNTWSPGDVISEAKMDRLEAGVAGALQTEDSTTIGRALLGAATQAEARTAIGAGTSNVAASAVEAIVLHDGTSTGPARPTGYARVRWVNPVGTAYGRPTNMATGDIWERDQ